jgi:hypothetical protein
MSITCNLTGIELRTGCYTVKQSVLLLCVWEVAHSVVVPEVSYTDRDFSGFPQTLEEGSMILPQNRPRPHSSRSFFLNHPAIRCHITYADEWWSLKKFKYTAPKWATTHDSVIWCRRNSTVNSNTHNQHYESRNMKLCFNKKWLCTNEELAYKKRVNCKNKAQYV